MLNLIVSDTLTTIYIHIVNESETNIWGLSGRERLRRMLKRFAQSKLVDNPEQIPAPAQVLLLRADYLFDSRVLVALIDKRANLVLTSDEGQPVAIRITDGNVPVVLADFRSGGKGQAVSVLPHYALKDLNLLGAQQTLKKRDQPY